MYLSFNYMVVYYSHSIVGIWDRVNSTRALTCAYIYSRQHGIVPKPELTRNSALSSTLARAGA